MAFPKTFEEAKSTFKPLRRSPRKRVTLKTGVSRKPLGGHAMARKRPIKVKVKKLTPGQLKKRAWKEFSIFIRTRRADVDGFVLCVTCGAKKHWRDVQAGHFIAGRLNSNLFDERGCNEQCSLCNVIKSGNGPMYYKWMLANHGQEIIDELITQNDQTRKWLPGELKAIWQKYKALNAANPLVTEAR